MILTKKKKIQKYLAQRENTEYDPFDHLLFAYLDGSLRNTLAALDIKRTEIHIDWYDDIKCIGIQGRCKGYYMDLQIYPEEFTLSFDLSEPDEDTVYPLESKEQVYLALKNAIIALSQKTP